METMLHRLVHCQATNRDLHNIDNDPLNTSNSRNVRNSARWAYNCGGYALNTFTWYIVDKYRRYDLDTEAGMSQATKVAIKGLLHDIPTLRVIQSLSDLAEDEYAIAFRIASDGDFHFLKRAHNGHWFHKMGSSEFISTIEKEEVFSDEWVGRYDGPIVLFAKKLA